MGKLGNLAYNIGTSLNKEDIDNHRQGITPTAQTLQGLSTDERLAYHAQNQALLDENKRQLEGEKESGDKFESYTPPGVSNEACTGVECSDRQIIAQLNACKRDASQCRDYPEHLKVAASILAPTTKEEVAFMVATAGGGYVLKVAGKAGVKIIRSFKSGKELDEAVEQAQRTNSSTISAKKADKPTTTQTKATCTTGNSCFTAGTFIETSEGLKAIETFTGGELVWTRNDITLEYGYRPVIATKATPEQPIFQVTVKNHQGDIETLETTAEHPFWIKDTGWLKASLLEQGMILLDRNNQEVEVLSQYLILNRLDTVYNIEVDDFHTYHVGKVGVWVHNADCCEVNQGSGKKPATNDDVKANLDSSTGENVFAQNPNIRFGSAEDRQKATDRIAKHRTDKGLNNKGNFGYLEGTINGQAVDNRMWRSTGLDQAIEETHIFTSTNATGGNGKTWNRMTDSEYRMLNRLAQDLGAKKGGVYPNVRGELKIVSENKICESCQGVIKQFNTMFPNIKLTLIGGVRKQ